MGEENTQPSTLERLEAITKRLASGAAAQAATNPANPPAATGKTDEEIQQASKTLLQKNFETLARERKEFRHLSADRVMDDPRAFIRAKNASGHYVVQDHDLETMCRVLLAKDGREIEDAQPVTNDHGGLKLYEAAGKGLFGTDSLAVRKTLDVGGGSGGPLVRTDLEQMLWEIYLREFTVAERIQRIRSNGVSHSYSKRTAIPGAQTTNSLGDFSGAFSNSTFGTDSAPIAIIVSPTGIGMKLAAAVEQSGMVNFDLSGSNNLEVVGAVTSIAKKNQTLILQGNKSTAAKTLNDEEGLTDANAFDGLRAQLKGEGTSTTKAGGDTYRELLKKAARKIRNAGGSARNIVAFCSLPVEGAIDAELEDFYRITNSRPEGGVDLHLSGGGLRLSGKYLSEIIGVPADAQGNGMGYYNIAGPTTVEDIDVVDLTGMSMAWLISPSPTILELPPGYNNTLSRVFVPFLMNGLVVHTVNFQHKIRVPQISE
jgi:hypothetical protein